MDRVLVVLIPAVDKGTHNWGPDPDGRRVAARRVVRRVAILSCPADGGERRQRTSGQRAGDRCHGKRRLIAVYSDGPQSARSVDVCCNHPSLWWFFNKVKRLWLASLKRRSQTARLSWERFTPFVARFFPPIRTLHPLPCHRFDARTRGRSPVR
jgi:hypothetical protein